jgi:hypothetical protein
MGILENILDVPARIHAWFDAHADIRAPFKTASIWLVGYGILRLTAILPELPLEQLGLATFILGALGYVLNYMQTHTTWVIVGARSPATGAKKKR